MSSHIQQHILKNVIETTFNCCPNGVTHGKSRMRTSQMSQFQTAYLES